MPANIPDAFKDLFHKKTFAHLATLMPNGHPQVTPVWVEFDGTHLLVNSAKGRRKDKNMRGNPHVALSMCDPDNPFRYLEVRGKVVEITEKGADEMIDRLAKRYIGQDKYPWRGPGEVRVAYKILPEAISTMAPS